MKKLGTKGCTGNIACRDITFLEYISPFAHVDLLVLVHARADDGLLVDFFRVRDFQLLPLTEATITDQLGYQ